MNKNLDCENCVFFKEDGFVDMNAHYDVCDAHPDIWQGLLSRSVDKFHCKYFRSRNIYASLRYEVSKRWKKDLQEVKK